MKSLLEYDFIEGDPRIETDRPLSMCVHAMHEAHGLHMEVAAVVFPIPSIVGLRGMSKISKLIIGLDMPNCNGLLFHYDRGQKHRTDLARIQRNLAIRNRIQPALRDVVVKLESIGNPIGTGLALTKGNCVDIIGTIEELEKANNDWMTNAGIGKDGAYYPDPKPDLLELMKE